MKSRVGERGQITIPKRLREHYGIQPGDEVRFTEEAGRLVIARNRKSDPLLELVGLVREPLDVDAYLAQTRGPALPRKRVARRRR